MKKIMVSGILMLCASVVSANFKSSISDSWIYIPVKSGGKGFIPQENGVRKVFKLDEKHFADIDSVVGRKGDTFDKCIIQQEFELDSDKIMIFGMGSDWWFDFYMNGKKVYSTIGSAAGNMYADFGIDNHVFAVQGKKGKNQIKICLIRGTSSWDFYFAELDLPLSSIDPESPVTVTVDKNTICGPIKIMNAVNNGPLRGSGWNPKGSGNMPDWRKLKIPYARTHDSAFLSAYGGEFTVDVHRIFTDFSKDPYDPASYDFTSTDHYLKLIEDGGTKVFYRLGASIEHTVKKYGTRVPADFKKWAIICEHIIRHYTEGWANGYKMDIEYWEIWNEPDLKGNPSPTWQGTPEQFFELYRTTALHLKKCFPKLKIGGPAVTGGGVDGWMRKFLKAMTAGERVPIDFFSWHIYSKEPRQVIYKAAKVRKALDEFGYQKTESILNEWNYVRNWTKSDHRVSVICGEKGAAFVASVMASCQNIPLDMLMYYDARPSTWNGIFETLTYKRLKTYYVFKIWSKLRELGKQIKIDLQGKAGLFGVAATDGKKIGIMLSRYFEQDDLPKDLKVTINVPGVDLRGVTVYMIDDKNDLTDVPYRMTANGDLVIEMRAHSIVYIEK